jgi:2-methylcitrate dehydratase PrpD
VRDPRIVALRDRIVAAPEPGIDEDAVRIAVILDDGERVPLDVEHAVGSLEKPLSDEAITAKFVNQSVPVIGEERTKAVVELAWSLERVPEVGAIARAGAA